MPPGPDVNDRRSLRPNVLIVLTDDQGVDTLLPTDGGSAMPWLRAQLDDPAGRWVTFSNAFVNTPLCCPSRASILTGLTSVNTGVSSNTDGSDLDESSTLATWLDDGGYTTALIGKYLNGFPWDRGPYVPPGWGRFVAKLNQGVDSTYQNFGVIDQGVPLTVGATPEGYATDYLANESLAFLRSAPTDRPWFLLFAPTAPHAPRTPAPADVGAFADEPVPNPSERVLNDVRGKPGWVQDLPAITLEQRAHLVSERRRERETLLAVDRAMEGLVSEIAARGEMGRTIIIFLTDNGVSFGEHRWRSKRCPYETCVHTPLVIRTPWREAATVDIPVSNVDLAPTIVDLAASPPPPGWIFEGESLSGFLDPTRTPSTITSREGVLLQFAGDAQVPPWTAVRTRDFKLIASADGTIELYDLTGAIGPADPRELDSRVFVPRYAQVKNHLEGLLSSLVQDERRG
jgi:N-acetylglucosamine-6-sulfatase